MYNLLKEQMCESQENLGMTRFARYRAFRYVHASLQSFSLLADIETISTRQQSCWTTGWPAAPLANLRLYSNNPQRKSSAAAGSDWRNWQNYHRIRNGRTRVRRRADVALFKFVVKPIVGPATSWCGWARERESEREREREGRKKKEMRNEREREREISASR